MEIGDIIQGGVMFYTGDTYALISATVDISQSLYWGCYKTGLNTTTVLGSGLNNSYIIMSGCSSNTMIAASACLNLSHNGYSDWFLPSKDELNLMYVSKDIIGGFDIYDNYWSSSQYTPECAYYQYFLTGLQSELGGKDQLYKVRPIRLYVP